MTIFTSTAVEEVMPADVAYDMALQASACYTLTACEKYSPLDHATPPPVHIIGTWYDEPDEESVSWAMHVTGDEYDTDLHDSLLSNEPVQCGLRSDLYFTLSFGLPRTPQYPQRVNIHDITDYELLDADTRFVLLFNDNSGQPVLMGHEFAQMPTSPGLAQVVRDYCGLTLSKEDEAVIIKGQKLTLDIMQEEVYLLEVVR